MTTRGATLAALLSALSHPSWWILALAGFLVRGGILLFLLAIVTLPSPLALSNVLGPIITAIYLGHADPSVLALMIGAVVIVLALLVGGGGFAAVTEVILIGDARAAASEEGMTSRPLISGTGRWLIVRAATAHLVALLPMVVVLGVGSVQIFGVAYRELLNPSDNSSLVLRVIGGASGQVAAIVAVWVLGEIVGGGAVRRIVLGGEPIIGAVLRSAVDLVRRPAGALLAPLATTGVLVVDLGAMLAVIVIVWTEVRNRLVRAVDDPLATALALATLGAAWCLALIVTGLIDAWRSAAMTFELERVEAVRTVRPAVPDAGKSQTGPSEDGTIGASSHGRPGDWSADDPGGSL